MILTLISLIWIMNFCQGQQLNRVKSYSVNINGTSTLHDWESKATKLEWIGLLDIDESKNVSIEAGQLKMLVEGIKSEHGRIMDNKTWEAFEYEKHPFIIFKIHSQSQKVSGGEMILTVEGDLTMAGTTKKISVNAASKWLPNGDIQFIGFKTLNMKEFNMTPPSVMMGTIKVGPEVTIKFDVVLTK